MGFQPLFVDKHLNTMNKTGVYKMPNTLEFANTAISNFLYSQNSPPTNLADAALIRPANAIATNTIGVSVNDYMTTVGRFALPSQFLIVQLLRLCLSNMMRMEI